MIHTFNVNFTTSWHFRQSDKPSIEMCRYKIMDSIRYIKQRYYHHGYVYLNEVYEYFGMRWNPHDENNVFIFKRQEDLKFDVSEPVKVDGFDTIVVTMEYT